MAFTYQVSCPPGAKALLADRTLRGGNSVTIKNSHATEPLYVGGDENELPLGNGFVSTLTLSTGIVLTAGEAFSVVIDGNEALYGRSGTSTVTITAHVFRSNARVAQSNP